MAAAARHRPTSEDLCCWRSRRGGEVSRTCVLLIPSCRRPWGMDRQRDETTSERAPFSPHQPPWSRFARVKFHFLLDGVRKTTAGRMLRDGAEVPSRDTPKPRHASAQRATPASNNLVGREKNRIVVLATAPRHRTPMEHRAAAIPPSPPFPYDGANQKMGSDPLSQKRVPDPIFLVGSGGAGTRPASAALLHVRAWRRRYMRPGISSGLTTSATPGSIAPGAPPVAACL